MWLRVEIEVDKFFVFSEVGLDLELKLGASTGDEGYDDANGSRDLVAQ